MSFSDNDQFWLGQSIGERQRYRIDARLGRGGMGDVFLAIDTILGKKVALKLLKGALTTTEEFKKRFDREVAICAALNSDHIVQVTDYGTTTQGQPFYVMEFLQGQTLRQLLMQRSRFPVAEALHLIMQVCIGLQTAHEGVYLWKQGAATSELVRVVHRDLKPDNIFLIQKDSGTIVKLLDFGIAKIFYEDPENRTMLTRNNEFMGTPRYASPEQINGLLSLDARADIYSLGVILYEMLCGQSPFYEEGKSLTSMMAWAIAHTSKSPRPLRFYSECLQISASLESIILKCLHKEPEDRFASVRELRESLQRELLQAQSSIPAPGANIPPDAVELAETQLKVSEAPHTPGNPPIVPSQPPQNQPPQNQPPQNIETTITPVFIQRCEQELAKYIGPIAHFILEDTLAQSPSIAPEELVQKLSNEIVQAQQAKQFKETLL